MSTRITQRELESYLWGAAVVLRGLIDAGDYKQFIFPLLFLKRLSDVYDEEQAAALVMYEGDEELANLPGEDLARLISTLEEEMREASSDLRFEYAARLRDEIKELKRELRQVG